MLFLVYQKLFLVCLVFLILLVLSGFNNLFIISIQSSVNPKVLSITMFPLLTSSFRPKTLQLLDAKSRFETKYKYSANHFHLS